MGSSAGEGTLQLPMGLTTHVLFLKLGSEDTYFVIRFVVICFA